jgi:hypothetical protein
VDCNLSAAATTTQQRRRLIIIIIINNNACVYNILSAYDRPPVEACVRASVCDVCLNPFLPVPCNHRRKEVADQQRLCIIFIFFSIFYEPPARTLTLFLASTTALQHGIIPPSALATNKGATSSPSIDEPPA